MADVSASRIVGGNSAYGRSQSDFFFERFRKVGCPYCGSQYFNELDEEGEAE